METRYEEEGLKERTREIEKSIIKRFRKEIWRPFVKALNEYEMIQEGDQIAEIGRGSCRERVYHCV